MSDSADKKLAQRLLDGDKRSFDVFFASYYPRLYRFALARLDNDWNYTRDLRAGETPAETLQVAIDAPDIPAHLTRLDSRWELVIFLPIGEICPLDQIFFPYLN